MQLRNCHQITTIYYLTRDDMVAPLVSYKLFRSLWTRGISFLINETQFFFSKTNILETEVSDSLFLGLNVWDLDESCTLKKINHSKSLELWNLYTNGQNNSNVINCIVAICIDR
ncbi:unnamed protein product [Rhizophagus irregularis]|nr:unnamed protein product [Rhizophagus irregularis]